MLLAYVIGGAAVFMVMRAMGELALAHPVSGAFSEYATRYLGRWAGFVTGWTYAPGNGAGCHRGRHRLCRVHEVLVPEQPLLDLDCLGSADSARH